MEIFASIKEIHIGTNILIKIIVMRDIKSKGQMLGWTVLGIYSIDLTQRQQVDWALII